MATTAETIRNAASTLFADRGFDAVSIRDIVSKAHVNLAAVHYHFGNKKKLYQDILSSFLGQVTSTLQELTQSKLDPAEKIRLFTHRYLTFIYRHPAISSIMAKEIANGAHNVPAIIERYMRPNLQMLSQFIQEGMERKQFRSLDARLAAINLIAMCIFFFFAKATVSQVLNQTSYTEEFIEKIATHISDLFLAGLKA